MLEIPGDDKVNTYGRCMTIPDGFHVKINDVELSAQLCLAVDHLWDEPEAICHQGRIDSTQFVTARKTQVKIEYIQLKACI